MADTGDLWKDALTSMKNHLTVKQSDWAVSDIFDFPAYLLQAQLNTISLELAPNTTSNLFDVGDGITTHEQVAIRITYVSQYIMQQSQYTEMMTLGRAIVDYLWANRTVDSLANVASYGSIGVGTIQVEDEGRHAYLMQIDVVLEKYKHHS